MTLRTGSKRGLTLIEILVSVVILASAVVFIMQALARSTFTLALAKNRLAAYAFSSAKMAELETAYAQGAVPKEGAGHFRVGRDEFDWRVDASASSEDPQLERVTPTVEWRQGSNAYESQMSMLQRVVKGEP